jgi:alpha-L-arabinofuranosidase
MASASSVPSSSSSSSSSAPTANVSAQIVVDAANTLASIGAHQIGTNLAIWYDVTTPTLPGQIAQVAPTILRWPGGSTSDLYHWQSQTECPQNGTGAGTPGPAYAPNSTFDNFMNLVVIPGSYNAAITVNYGTNASCNGGGDPTEAAAWVAYAKQKGYNQYIHYWTVGNEEFGGWEADLHNPAHDGPTYGAAMSGPNGYYQLMKAADPTAQVGAFVLGGPGYNNWDSSVLSTAQYDFVELHWYAQQPGQESDSWLLSQGPAALTQAIATLRQELQTAGKPSTPIMLGEVNSVAYNQGKQTTSVVNALFAGMVVGEVLQDNVAIATWWFGAGGSQGCNNNNSSSLYGWQNFGSYDLVASNTAYAYNYCTSNTGSEIVPEGTVFPSGNAFAMAQQFAQPGSSVLGVSVAASLPNVRAYAASQGKGYALMLFNLSQTDTTTATVGVQNAAAGSFTGSTVTYGKQQYDDSQNNVWTGPVTGSLGTVQSSSLQVTLPPFSMTVVKLQ